MRNEMFFYFMDVYILYFCVIGIGCWKKRLNNFTSSGGKWYMPKMTEVACKFYDANGRLVSFVRAFLGYEKKM